MEFLKKLFKDEETVVGLCAFKKQEKEIEFFIPKFDASKPLYCPKYENNLFLL